MRKESVRYMNSYPYESLTTNEIDMMYFRIQENAFDDKVEEICDMVHLLGYLKNLVIN